MSNGTRPPGVSRKKWAEWKRRARGFRVHGVLLEPAGAAPYPSAEQPNPYGKHAVERQFRRAQRNQARIVESYGEPAPAVSAVTDAPMQHTPNQNTQGAIVAAPVQADSIDQRSKTAPEQQPSEFENRA